MSKREKRLAKLRENPNNVSFDELVLVLEDFGFEQRPAKGTSHRFFRAQIGNNVWSITIPYHRPVKAIYVRQALEMINEIEKYRTGR